MGKKQSAYSNEFKFNVIKEVLREDRTILEIANKHGITPKIFIIGEARLIKRGQIFFHLTIQD